MPRQRGRESKLTPALQQAIVNAVAAGVSLSTAADLAGVHPTTAKEWVQRGLGEHPDRSSTPLYRSFADAIIRAKAQDETRRIARIEQAGRGGAVIYRKTTTHRDGSVSVEERYTEPAYQADCWHLERSRPESWGRKDRVDLRLTIEQAAQKVADEMGLTVEEVLAEAQALLSDGAHADVP